jgi:hypothetical protein
LVFKIEAERSQWLVSQLFIKLRQKAKLHLLANAKEEALSCELA